MTNKFHWLIILTIILSLFLISCNTGKERFDKVSNFGEVLFQRYPNLNSQEEDVFVVKTEQNKIYLIILSSGTVTKNIEISYKLYLGTLCNINPTLKPEIEK